MSIELIKALQDQIDKRTESLRQAVASIDRLTAEKASRPLFVFSPSDIRDLPGVTASPPDYPVAHYKHTIQRLKDDVVKYQREIGDLQNKVDTLRTAKDNLYDDVVQLRRANQALHDEVVASKARTLAQPGDHEDMDILGRLFKRLVSQGRMLITQSDSASDGRIWVRVEPNRCWDYNRYVSDSRLGQILLGLKK